MTKYTKPLAIGFAMLLTSATASAAVVWDTNVHHSTEVGTAAGVLAGSLGTGTSSFSGASGGGWAGAVAGLSAGDILLLGQASRTDILSAADSAAIGAFTAAGGTVIQLWGDTAAVTSHSLLSSLSGDSLVWTSGGSTSSPNPTKTAAAAGTSFGGIPPAMTLVTASNHGGITLGSLGGFTSMYETASASHVAVKGLGAGTLAFVSWDFCCSASAATRASWDDVLFAAATYSANVSESATLGLMLVGLAGIGVARRRRQSVPAA